MRISLRNEHLLVWVVIALGSAFFLVSRGPELVNVKDPGDAPADSITVSASIAVEDSVWWVELDVPKLPVAPSAFVFASEQPYPDADNAQPVGQLTTPGAWRFPLPPDVLTWEELHVSVVDVLRDSVLLTMTLQR